MSIRPVPLALALLAGLAAAPVPTAFAQDPSVMSCAQLWHRKNAVLKARGFCFTEAQAIRTFGNEGCTVHDPNRVPLTSADRQLMARIVIAQKMKLCR